MGMKDSTLSDARGALCSIRCQSSRRKSPCSPTLYTRVTKVYPFRRSDPSASRLSSAVDLCGAHSVDVTECALPSFARSKMLKPIRSIFSIQVHVHVRYSVLAFVCATPARPLRTLRKRHTHPGQTSWQTCTLQRLHRGQQTWSSIVDDAARTIELQLACTSVAHIRRQRTPLCTLASVGSASGMAAPVRGGGAPCAAFDSRFGLDSGKSASNECGTSGPSDLYSGPQNVTAHACVHMTHATIMQHAK